MLVNPTTSHDTVTEQYMDVVMKFISHDFETKSWSYSEWFDTHISPTKNIAAGIKSKALAGLCMYVQWRYTMQMKCGITWINLNM